MEEVNSKDKPTEMDEFSNASKFMPNNKAQGLDGIPTEFYKHFLTSTTVRPIIHLIE